MDKRVQVKYLPEYAIVQLEDGRVGWVSRHTNTGKPWVMLQDTGVEVKQSDIVTLMRWPAQVVREYLEWYSVFCPKCNSINVEQDVAERDPEIGPSWGVFVCQDCEHSWGA